MSGKFVCVAAVLAVCPVSATLLNTGKRLDARVEMMPVNRFFYDRESLHVWGIPIDDLSGECVIIKLEFTPGQIREIGKSDVFRLSRNERRKNDER